MSKILAIVKLKLLQLRRNKTLILMMTISPILFTLLIGNVDPGSQDKQNVFIVDQDQTIIAQELINSLDTEIYTIHYLDESDMLERVQNREIRAGYLIPKGFGESLLTGLGTEIKIVKLPDTPSHPELPTLLQSAAHRILGTYQVTQVVMAVIQNDGHLSILPDHEQVSTEVGILFSNSWAIPQLTTSFRTIVNDHTYVYDQKAQASMGYLIFFLMFSLTLSISEILYEKKAGTWTRQLSTPTRSGQILAGHFVGTMVLGVIQIVVLVYFGSKVMGVQWGRSIPGVMMILLSLIFALTALGLMLAGIVKSRRQLSALSPVLIVSTSMLGGCMWPLEIVPDFMKTIARFIPQGQAMMGLTDLVMRGGGLEKALPPTFALLGMGVLFFSIAVPLVNKKI